MTRLALARITLLAFAIALFARHASAQDKFILGTNWVADAERGGFYQALASGAYARHGLDVEIKPGGAQVNNPMLLVAGRLDAVMVTSAVEAFSYARSDVPLVAVAGIYQRSPQILLAHKSAGIHSLAEMRGRPIMISSLARNGFWLWLKAKYGFTDDQIRPYTFNLVNFLANPQAIQQGFVTYEPYAVRTQGADPEVFLLADSGYSDYGGIILVRRDTLEGRREVVRRFIQASSEGWRDFLFGDSTAGLALIKQLNPQITDALLANSMSALRERHLIDTGDAATFGIGAMTEARWRQIHDDLLEGHVIEPGDYWTRAFDVSLVASGLAMPPRQ